ncbi:morphogenetic protein [Pseudomonas sp. FP818]|uniref:morphogenetic protein n=1 Tax=Pseudomonas sp. FP818 TaxID=2954099 RepID=UPI002736FB7F|nr:morphogenetic protein [Pseudomonas sp. FP818]WLI32915.1 morphogenetic protein [Pseudomonas sp. FP818]
MSQIKERPILFSAPMVRAILEGRKTVTRRAIKVQPHIDASGNFCVGSSNYGQDGYGKPVTKHFVNGCCPYGKPGDRLWVRETFALLGNEDGCCIDWQDNLVKGDERGAARIYRASCPTGDYGLNQIPAKAEWKPDTEAMEYDGAWRPSIHMPRWASRILLEITDVRVERLQDGEGETAFESRYIAEGINRIHQGDGDYAFHPFKSEPGPGSWTDPFDAWRELWVGINGAESWNANPWVWVVEFKRVTP